MPGDVPAKKQINIGAWLGTLAHGGNPQTANFAWANQCLGGAAEWAPKSGK
jgi:hypothetical protein